MADDYRHVRERCGYYPMEEGCIFSLTGKDTFAFLQTQSTNDALNLERGAGLDNAIVDRKGKLIANFSLHRDGGDSALALIEKCQKDNFQNHLETFHFREDIVISPLNDRLLAMQGPLSRLALESLCDPGAPIPEKPNQVERIPIAGKTAILINKSFTGEEGFILGVRETEWNSLIEALQRIPEDLRPALVSKETWEVLRIEAGILRMGKDMDGKNVLPETGLEHTSVSYNKGCYIGQEVIARIRTYGAPNFAMMGLILEGGPLPPPHSDILLKDKKIGSTRSGTLSPYLGKNIVLAYIQKDYRSPDTDLEVTLAGSPARVRTCLLPFYQTKTRQDHARRLYEEALTLYKQEENLDQPIGLLREAIALDSKYAAAYEALGVFLSKQDKLDEAISLMKRLVEIDPTEIMAHSNLSIYYMKQGRIEDAENEKAEATAIQFEKAITEKMNQRKQQGLEEQQRQERERKIGMFKEVLEIDPGDPVANFGLGSIFLETGRYEEALHPLQIVIEQNRDYSAAYLLLGKTWEKLQNPEEAVKTFKTGIATASRKGDLMPLKEMQNRMVALTREHPQLASK
ncbi:MAG: aminomethyltransferase [Nitrospinae bacterium CG11_big_fil_rev_8_21_14_0_20_56_8]|nr:MAG: aminomethyltransferase [Nitrospinae bacterium CG11_big_fil_rev_8_21_14_0_20_56_8]